MSQNKFNLVPHELDDIANELGEDTLRDDFVRAYISMVRDLAKERARLLASATRKAELEPGPVYLQAPKVLDCNCGDPDIRVGNDRCQNCGGSVLDLPFEAPPIAPRTDR